MRFRHTPAAGRPTGGVRETRSDENGQCRQKHRNDRAFRVLREIECDLHLLILRRAEARTSERNDHTSCTLEPVLDKRAPHGTGTQLLFVKPDPQAAVFQGLFEKPCVRFVVVRVAKKRVEIPMCRHLHFAMQICPQAQCPSAS